MNTAEKLAAKLQAENPEYTCRALPDGSVACVFDLMFTRAIILAAHDWGYNRRFCFEDRALADQRFHELQSKDDEPQGYIAKRDYRAIDCKGS